MPFLLLALFLLSTPGCALLQRPAEGGMKEPVRDSRLLDPAFPRLRIEVDRVEGVVPRSAALASFRESLAFYVDKPSGVEVVMDETLPKDQWDGSSDGLKRLVSQHFQGSGEQDTADIYILYAPSWKKYRGYCYRGGTLSPSVPFPVMVILADSLKPILWLTGTTQEHAVLVHEAGHALGLVTSPHHAVEGHCTQGWCAMYKGVDLRSGLVWLLPALFAGELPTHYCRACRGDLWPQGLAPGLRAVPGLPDPEHPGCDPQWTRSRASR